MHIRGSVILEDVKPGFSQVKAGTLRTAVLLVTLFVASACPMAYRDAVPYVR